MAKNIKKIKVPGVVDAYNVVDATAIHPEDVASSTKAGVVKIGTGITVAADGTISVNVSAPVTSVNGKTGVVSLSASDVGAVPTTRTVNGKALSSNITLSASDVSALPSTTTALKNPNKLTFTGGATGSYDGSAAMTVNIPNASGGTSIVVSRTQPTGQKAGDFWFQIVD